MLLFKLYRIRENELLIARLSKFTVFELGGSDSK